MNGMVNARVTGHFFIGLHLIDIVPGLAYLNIAKTAFSIQGIVP